MDFSQKVRKAQRADGARGAIGGNSWNALEVLKAVMLPPDEIVKFVYLAEGPNLTASLNIGRDNVALHLHDPR